MLLMSFHQNFVYISSYFHYATTKNNFLEPQVWSTSLSDQLWEKPTVSCSVENLSACGLFSTSPCIPSQESLFMIIVSLVFLKQTSPIHPWCFDMFGSLLKKYKIQMFKTKYPTSLIHRITKCTKDIQRTRINTNIANPFYSKCQALYEWIKYWRQKWDNLTIYMMVYSMDLFPDRTWHP